MLNENLNHPTKKTKIYIPCWKTIVDLISGDKKYGLSTKVFFEYLSIQAPKEPLQSRLDPVASCRTYPIENKLCEILWEQYDKSKDEKILKVLALVLSTLTTLLLNYSL